MPVGITSRPQPHPVAVRPIVERVQHVVQVLPGAVGRIVRVAVRPQLLQAFHGLREVVVAAGRPAEVLTSDLIAGVYEVTADVVVEADGTVTVRYGRTRLSTGR